MFRGEEKVVTPLVRLRGLNLGASLKGTAKEKKGRKLGLIYNSLSFRSVIFQEIGTKATQRHRAGSLN